jgi:2'-5' RNA ligase
MSTARYAIYLAPPAGTPLWRFGSEVLGYDAASVTEIHGFAPHGIEPATWRRITMRPRPYGFHGTLKAPFRLAEGCGRTNLIDALEDFAASRDAFDLGPLAVTSIADDSGHGFVALTPSLPSAALVQLEADAVRAFDRFRAPLSEAERMKRKPAHLTERQRAALEQFGYPFVGPDYRFHMTLSGDIADVHEIADKLADAMANAIGTVRLSVDALVLFEQAADADTFRIIRRANLRSPQHRP